MNKLENVRKFPGFNKRMKEFINKGDSFGNIESMILLYLMDYIDFCGPNKKYGGNTIKIDRAFKNNMIEDLSINDNNISKALNKFYNAGVLYKIKNGLYQFNPWLVAKGTDYDVIWLRKYGVFKEYVYLLDTYSFRNKYEIIKSVQRDELSTTELLEGEKEGLKGTEVMNIYKILESLGVITSDEIISIINGTFEFPEDKFEKLDKLLKGGK